MNWVRSSKCSGGECVEIGAWIRSSACDQGACIEVAQGHEGDIGIRNSQAPADAIWFTRDEWAAFAAGVKAGEFDL